MNESNLHKLKNSSQKVLRTLSECVVMSLMVMGLISVCFNISKIELIVCGIGVAIVALLDKCVKRN